MLLIAAAMEEELKTGIVHCQDSQKIRSQGVDLWRAVRDDKTIFFLKTGIGPRRSAASLEEALREIKPSRILVVGYAGALDPGLKLGDLVAVAKALALSLDQDHPDWAHVQVEGEFELSDCSALALSAKSAGLSASAGDALTSRYVLGDPVHKRFLFEQFHASIVDMETAALSRVAVSREIPISCIRVVSDVAQDTFLAPFSHDPSTGFPTRAKRLLDTGLAQTYQTWKEHAHVAGQSLNRFLAHYLA
jgi:nucleoside phosphorylase